MDHGGDDKIGLRTVGPEHKQDIHIPNEPFRLWGRMYRAGCFGG